MLMGGRTRARITRMCGTFIRREKARALAKADLTDWMRTNMEGAGRAAIIQADKLLCRDYDFHKGLMKAWHKAEEGAPMEDGILTELSHYAAVYLKAEKAYQEQQEKLRRCILEYFERQHTVEYHDMEAVDEVIGMLPACYLRFNMFEIKVKMEEEIKKEEEMRQGLA